MRQGSGLFKIYMFPGLQANELEEMISAVDRRQEVKAKYKKATSNVEALQLLSNLQEIQVQRGLPMLPCSANGKIPFVPAIECTAVKPQTPTKCVFPHTCSQTPSEC